MKKKVSRKRLIILLAILAFIVWRVFGPFDYCCYRCCAEKVNWPIIPTIYPTEISEWLASEGYTDCEHDWVYNSSFLGCADAFARHKIPMSHLSVGKMVISKMPEQQWKTDILHALMDRDNKLRWLIPDVLFTALPSDEWLSREEWEEWHKDYADLFVVEYDAKVARKKAERIIALSESKYENFARLCPQKLEYDLEE